MGKVRWDIGRSLGMVMGTVLTEASSIGKVREVLVKAKGWDMGAVLTEAVV